MEVQHCLSGVKIENALPVGTVCSRDRKVIRKSSEILSSNGRYCGVDNILYVQGQQNTLDNVKESLLSSYLRGELSDRAHLHLELNENIHSKTYQTQFAKDHT